MSITSDVVAALPSNGDQLRELVDVWLPAFGALTTYDFTVPWQWPALSTTLGVRRTPEHGRKPCVVT
jgi:hypothetical protein